jgi:type IV pilus assembly protein PilM
MPHDRDDKPTSLWKKELSFKRKPREEAPDEERPVASEAGSVWKKDLSLRRKSKPQPAEPVASVEEPVEPVPAVVPAPVVSAPAEPAPPVDHGWLTQPLEEVSEPPAEETTGVLPPARPALHALPQPETESQFEPQLLPGPLPVPAPDQAPEPELPPPAAAADHLLPPEQPLLPDDVLAALLPDLALPGLSAPVAPEPEPEPERALEEQEPAQPESAPEPIETVEKVPFYKRELSFGRGGSKAERAPKAKKPPRKQREPRKRASRDEWEIPTKRKLSFGLARKPAAPLEDAQPLEEPRAEQAPKAKRERPQLRFARRPKAIAPGGKGTVKLVGLKIGSSQLAAARIQNGAVPELVQAVRGPLEPGIVVGGELRDPEALAVALKEFFKQHKLPRRGVRLGIANNRIGVRTFDVAGIDDPKQLDNAIKFRAQEVLPIPIEEAVLDYQVLSEFTDGEGQLTRRVLLVVAYRELVDRYLLACAKAGIQVVGIDLEAFALLRALAEPRAEIDNDERGALVAVAVGHERSTFAVSDGRVCEFTRVLEWGGWTMNVAIARALDTAPSEAEPIKRALSFAGPEELPAGITEEQLGTAREAARRQLQSFARELVSSLQFYQNQPGSLGIGEIVVTGGTTHMPGFGEELQRLIGVPVRVGDPLSRVKVSKKLSEHAQVGSLAVAIGLGIED